jgi:hypothetical protein
MSHSATKLVVLLRVNSVAVSPIGKTLAFGFWGKTTKCVPFQGFSESGMQLDINSIPVICTSIAVVQALLPLKLPYLV